MDSLVSVFLNRLLNSVSSVSSLPKLRKNISVPWLSREILHLSRRVNRLPRVRRSGDPEKMTQFNEAKEELRLKSNSAKDLYFRVTLQNYEM